MPGLKDVRREFRPIGQKVQSEALFTHKVDRGFLEGSTKKWIRKECKDPALARAELLAQEFFRLIIPHQPETRLLVDPLNNVHYIFSEEVRGYRPLPYDQAPRLRSGAYSGLGQASLVAAFLQESDFKNGNVGLDEFNRVIKIDGDWCFSEHRLQADAKYSACTYELSSETISALPYPKGFFAYNWLDLIRHGVNNPYSTIVDHSLQASSHIRNGINQAMLKICLLPDSFITEFVNAYIPAGADWFISTLRERRNLLTATAMKDPTFQEYITTDAALDDRQALIRSMKTFVANGEDSPIISSDDLQKSIESEITNQFNEMRAKYKAYFKAQEFLEKIYEKRINDKDDILLEYVKKIKRERFSFNLSLEELKNLNIELSKTYAAVSSPEVSAVKRAVASYRSTNHWWTRGKDTKANAIEAALLRTPLDERLNVISGPQNDVQVKLASRRWGVGAKLKSDSGLEIINSPSKVFKNLKKKFGGIQPEDDKKELREEPPKKFNQ